MGIILMMVDMLTTGRVPSTGMKFECISLNMPDASPGIAASQNSSMVVNLKPMAGILTTTALMTNHVANENISENVVIPQVRQAIALPVSFQNCGSSGSHLGNLDMISFPLVYGRLTFNSKKAHPAVKPFESEGAHTRNGALRRA
ncbi:MAG: hypothetical protein HY848_01950 [Betaproteobacteria bacterium]|nr:hypothetical protein [Betaproteobacteria bacterium]